jgi:hypothetical protein
MNNEIVFNVKLEGMDEIRQQMDELKEILTKLSCPYCRQLNPIAAMACQYCGAPMGGPR